LFAQNVGVLNVSEISILTLKIHPNLICLLLNPSDKQGRKIKTQQIQRHFFDSQFISD
jgi:hypothetical protein